TISDNGINDNPHLYGLQSSSGEEEQRNSVWCFGSCENCIPIPIHNHSDLINKYRPLALITPAQSHPEPSQPEIESRRGICEEAWHPEVKDSYQGPSCIPLPNSLHLEWAVKSIRAGNTCPPRETVDLQTRKVTLHRFVHAIIWHRINVEDSYLMGAWVECESHKAYCYKIAGGRSVDLPGGVWWMSYQYQLGFVNCVKGRKTQELGFWGGFIEPDEDD
ncbi:oxidoreductase, partial [Penicillium sp. IBT 16267x]